MAQDHLVLSGLLAALRCLRLAPGLPAVGRFLRRDAHAFLAAVDRVVMPVVEATISDQAERSTIRSACRVAAIKFGIGVWGYARMAERPLDIDLTSQLPR